MEKIRIEYLLEEMNLSPQEMGRIHGGVNNKMGNFWLGPGGGTAQDELFGAADFSDGYSDEGFFGEGWDCLTSFPKPISPYPIPY